MDKNDENDKNSETLIPNNILQSPIPKRRISKVFGWRRTTKKKGIWENIKIFALDVAVVVIGVSLSTFINDRVSYYNQQQEVKKFLLGLQSDFVGDIQEMEEDKMSYVGHNKVFGYIASLKINEKMNRDSVNKYGEFLFNTTGLISNDSRFQGFKSSGKIGTIENDTLQNDILDLYQEDIPTLLISTDHLVALKMKFRNYIQENKVRETDSTSNLLKLLSSEKVHHMSAELSGIGIKETISRYNKCIAKMKKISLAIEKTYKK